MTNEYFVCTRNRPPVKFDLQEDRPVADAEIAYFIRGFRLLEKAFCFDGYIVCFAWSSNTPLPVVGKNVIALIYGDEHCRIPGYANKVAAVIKCHGLFPTYVPRFRPLRLAQIEMAEFVRNLALWLPNGWRWAFSNSVRNKCHLVPIGYGIPSSIQPVPMQKRIYATSFLGSIPQKSSRNWFRSLVGTPKVYCRQAMIAALEKLRLILPLNAVYISLTEGFQESLLDAGKVYSEILSQTKVCVAPRGTTHETWRLADGLRLGCVVISDKLPRHPFYIGSPIIQIDDWSRLPEIMQRLLDDPDQLHNIERESLRFWEAHLSEKALAQRYASALGLRPRYVPQDCIPKAFDHSGSSSTATAHSISTS